MRTAVVTAKIIFWLVFPNAVSSLYGGASQHEHLQHETLSTPSTSTSRLQAPTYRTIASLRQSSQQVTEQAVHTTPAYSSSQLAASSFDAIATGFPIPLLARLHIPVEKQSVTQTDRSKLSQSYDSDITTDHPDGTTSPDTTYSDISITPDGTGNARPDRLQENELSSNFNGVLLHKTSDMARETTSEPFTSQRVLSRTDDGTRQITAKPETPEKERITGSRIHSQRQRTTQSLSREFLPPEDSAAGYETLAAGVTLPNIVKKDGNELPKDKHTAGDATSPLQMESSTASTGTSSEVPGMAASRVSPSLSSSSAMLPTPESRPIKVQKKSDTATDKERIVSTQAAMESTQESRERTPTAALYVVGSSTEDPLILHGTGRSVKTVSSNETSDSAATDALSTNYAGLMEAESKEASTATTAAAQVLSPTAEDNYPEVAVKADEELLNPFEREGKAVLKTTHPQERIRSAGLPGIPPEHPLIPTESPLIVEPGQEAITVVVDKVKPQKPYEGGAKDLVTTTAEDSTATETPGGSVLTGRTSTEQSSTMGTDTTTNVPSTYTELNETGSSTTTTTTFHTSTEMEHTTEGRTQDCLRLQTGCVSPVTEEEPSENSTSSRTRSTSATGSSVQPEGFPDVSFCISVTLSGTWDKFCREVEQFRRSIADVLSLELRPTIIPRQVVIEDSCTQNRRIDGDVVVRMHLTDTEEHYSQKLTALAAVILHHNDRQHINLQMMNVCFYSSKSMTSTTLQKKPQQSMSSTGVIASITISAIAGTSLFLISVLLVVMRQRLQHSTGVPTTADGLSLASFKSSFRKKKIRQSLRSFLNEAFDDNEDFSKPVPFNSLPAALSNKDAIEEEFKRIPMNMARVDDMPQGVERKNRYANVIPIPETKVLLSSRPDDETSDYINANFVRGYKGRPQRYIACQAPLPETAEDFWRMIWEQQCKAILMLTACEENGVQRCVPYFPVNTLDCHKLYGDYQVTLQTKDVRPSFTCSTFKLHHLDKNLCREVYHCWYTAWPAQGVPEDVSSVVTFLLEARQYTSRSSAPIVVHCSPGTGRTGTVLAIDICMQELLDKRRVDVPRTVFRLRQDRGGAVQTKDQYAFIYEALYDYSARLAAQSQRPSIVSAS